MHLCGDENCMLSEFLDRPWES